MTRTMEGEEQRAVAHAAAGDAHASGGGHFVIWVVMGLVAVWAVTRPWFRGWLLAAVGLQLVWFAS